MSHRTEILEPACGGAPVPVVLSPEPFARGVRMVEAPAGVTVLQVLKAAVEAGDLDPADLGRTEVYIDGERLPRESALEVRLAEGQVVNVVVEPLGGGGGRRKDVGQVILQIAVIALAAWAGGAAGAAAAEAGMKAWAVYAAQAATTAAVMTVGNLAISALYSPESQGGRANDRYALQRASNRYRPWECFPLALGQVWAAPDLVAKTYTRNVGDEVWIHGILGLHYGPCEISDLKIGDTLVSSMGAGEARFAYHLTPGPRTFTIYPNDADQQDFTEELDKSGATVVRALGSEAEAFEIDVFLPEGLYFQKDDGRAIAADVTVTVRYRPLDEHGQPTGTGAWTAAPYPQARDSDGVIQPAGSFYLRNTTKEPWRVTRGFALPLGRYEFEVRRQPPDDGNEKRRDRILLTAIRGFAYRKPVADETLSIIEFAIKASALHQGTLAPITCRLTPVCPVWNGEDWSVEQATSNPAALLRWLATGPAPAKPLQPVQADAGLRAWYDLCEEYDWRAGVYLLEPRSQAEAFGLLEKAGRAGVFWDGSQLVASPWLDKPAPVQLFAGANLRDHTFSLAFPEPVHALRVEFQNLEQAGEPDELVVYNDGYGPVADPEADPPVQAATLVEAFRLDGQRTLERAYRDGRWELARRLHQRRVDTWTCDVEHIACRLGDRVRLSWWAIEDGASARVRCRLWSGALVAGLRLDQPVEMVEGQSYAVDLRVKDQLIQGVAVVTTPGLTRVLTFAAPRAAADCPARGDLVAFGRAAKVAEDVEVIAIEPAEDLSARLVGVRWVAPYLLAAETGPIPPLESRLTGERRSRPPAPTLLGVQGDPAGVRVTFAMPPWRGSPITGFAARWRLTPPDPLEGDAQDGGWSDLPALAATAMHLVTPPPRVLPAPAGDPEYAPRVDVEVVALAMDGQASEPLLVGGVLVREDPFPPQDFAVEPAVRTAEDGSSFGVLAVSALPLVAAAAVDLIVEARENPEDGEPGPWKPAGPPLRSSNPAGDILGLTAGLRYGLRARWRSAAGWDSDWTGEVFGTVPAGSNVSYDVSPTAPTVTILTGFIDEMDDRIDGAEANIAQVADDLDAAAGVFDAGLTAAEGRIDATRAALTAARERLSAELARAKTSVLAEVQVRETELATQITRIDALLIRMDDAEGGIDGAEALIATLETLTVNLENPSSLASQLAVISSALDTVEGALSAQITTLSETLTQTNADLADLAGDVVILDDGLVALQGDVEDQGDALVSLAGRTDLIEAEVDTLGDGVATNAAEIGSVRQAVATDFAAGTYASQWAAARTARGSVATLAETILRVTDTAALYSEIESVELNLSGDLSELEGTVGSHTLLIADLETNTVNLTTFNTWTATVTGLAGDLDDLADNVDGIDGRLVTAEGAISSSASVIAGLSLDLSDLGDGVTLLALDVDDHGDRLDDAEERLDTVEGETATIVTQISGIHASVSTLEGRADDADDVLDDLDDRQVLTEAGLLTVAQAAATERAAGLYRAERAFARTARGGVATLAETVLRVTDTQAVYDALDAVELDLTGEIDGLDGQLVTLSATVGSHTTAILDLEEGTVDLSTFETLAGEVETLDGTVSGHASRLDAVELDVEGRATVTSVTNLGLEVDDLSVDLGITMSAVSDLEGIVEAMITLAVDVNGRVTGIVIDGVEDAISLGAGKIYFGDDTVWDDASNTIITDDGAGARTIQLGPFGASGDLIFWQGAASTAPGAATTANGARAITVDGKVYVNGNKQQNTYWETTNNVPGTTISTSWVDVLTHTIGAGPGVNDSFHVQVGLGIQTSPSRTRSSSSVQAPGGDWEVVEQDSSGTTGTERKIASGKWGTSIFGGGANAEYVSSITLGSPSSAEMAERSDISREWPFKFGAGGRLVVRMRAESGANLITPVVTLWNFVTRFT